MYKSRVFVNYNPHDYHKENIYRSYIKGNEKRVKWYIREKNQLNTKRGNGMRNKNV